MNTSSTGSSLRVQLALAFGALAAVLAVALSLVIGHYASETARDEISRYLTRLAIEYRDRLDADAARPNDLERAARLRADIESYSQPASPFELLLVQSDGTVLLGPPDLAGKKVPMPLGLHVGAPAAIEQWPDGEKYLAGGSVARGAAGGPDPGWVTIARKRHDVAFAPVSALQRAILWAGLALALAGIGTGWLLAAYLARPLERLAAAAGDIAAGKHRAALPRLHENQEVARLSEALGAMLSHLREQAETLREAQDRMEHRVRERTAELVELQAQLELEIADTMVARDDVSRAHAQLSLALEASQLALWDLDVPSDRIFLSPYWSEMLGGPGTETRTTTRELFALVPEAERGRIREALAAALSGATADYRVEHPVRRPDGRLCWIASLGRVVERDPGGRARRLVGTNRDITERVEAQLARDEAIRSTDSPDPEGIQQEKRK